MLNICLYLAIFLACYFLIVAVVFAIVLRKITFFHHPLGRREWEFINKKVEPHFPGIETWARQCFDNGLIQQTHVELNGLQLNAYCLPHPEAKGTVVLTHGYSGCALQMMPYARLWHEEMGYNVLLHDMPNHGQSEGNMTCMGAVEHKALLRWIEKAHELWPDTSIYLQGISMGGATTLLALGSESLPQYVKGGIADSAFMTMGDEIFDESSKVAKKCLMPRPVLKFSIGLLNLMMRCQYGWGLYSAPTPLSCVSRCSLPILFVCGNADLRVNNRHSHTLHAHKASGWKKLLVTDGPGHCRSLIYGRQQYIDAINELLAQ